MTQKKTITQQVKMTDGRTVDFPVSRKMQSEILENAVRFDWITGATETFPLPDQHLVAAALNGWRGRLAAAAGNLKDAEGKSNATPEAMHAAIVELAGKLAQSTEWVEQGESNGSAHVVLKAFMQHSGKNLAAAKEWLAGFENQYGLSRQGAYSKLAASQALGPIIRQLENTSGPQIDVDALLEAA
jgi:hypothetical protein